MGTEHAYLRWPLRHAMDSAEVVPLFDMGRPLDVDIERRFIHVGLVEPDFVGVSGVLVKLEPLDACFSRHRDSTVLLECLYQVILVTWFDLHRKEKAKHSTSSPAGNHSDWCRLQR